MGAAAALLCVGAAVGAERCALCSTAVVTNSSLATCFLEKFAELAKKDGEAVVVDLSDCPTERGVVSALPSLETEAPAEPDTGFVLTRAQLDCLKAKLEEPGLVLDPQARIDLGSCG